MSDSSIWFRTPLPECRDS